MRTRRLAPLIALPVMLLALAGCSPDPYVEPEPPKFTDSMNELRSAGVEGIAEITANFALTADPIQTNQFIYPCDGEDDGIGRTINMQVFTTSDVDAGVTATQDMLSESLSSSGKGKKDIEYADGSTTMVSGQYLLFETTVGSFLIDYQRAEDGSGIVSITNRTACGVLR